MLNEKSKVIRLDALPSSEDFVDFSWREVRTPGSRIDGLPLMVIVKPGQVGQPGIGKE
jgi:hypothetical protein